MNRIHNDEDAYEVSLVREQLIADMAYLVEEIADYRAELRLIAEEFGHADDLLEAYYSE